MSNQFLRKSQLLPVTNYRPAVFPRVDTSLLRGDHQPGEVHHLLMSFLWEQIPLKATLFLLLIYPNNLVELPQPRPDFPTLKHSLIPV
jgi:hypothetical protein